RGLPHLRSFPTRRSSDLHHRQTGQYRPSAVALLGAVCRGPGGRGANFRVSARRLTASCVSFPTRATNGSPGPRAFSVALFETFRSEEHTTELQSRENYEY